MTRAAVVGVALAAVAGLGAATGSGGGADDVDWACPADRIALEVFTPAEGGGADSRASALRSLAPFLAADGTRSEAEYAEAISSATGPNRFERDSGTLYVDDDIEAQIALTRMGDGTWAPASIRLCGRPVPPELASPYPTPGVTGSTG